jgi:hypothetical protein
MVGFVCRTRASAAASIVSIFAMGVLVEVGVLVGVYVEVGVSVTVFTKVGVEV